MATSAPEDVDFLILGAGWTSNFLVPLLKDRNIKYAATTTTGRDGTISFKFDPDSSDLNPYKVLPNAKTIMITFPLKGEGQSQRLVDSYGKTHSTSPGWIQLGSTGIYSDQKLTDRKSPYDKSNDRAIAEDELLSLKDCKSTVLNLAGLYDDEIRRPRNWVSRVAKSKDDVYAKTAVHLIHGADVARAVVAVHEQFDKAQGQRWILTDSTYYDWWYMLLQWGGKLADGDDLRQTIGWCMKKGQVAQLPRSAQTLGRVLSSIEFWNAMDIMPEHFSV